MKTGRALIALAFFTLFIPAGGFGDGQCTMGSNEELYGTWTKVRGDFGKIISLPGRLEQYTSATDPEPYQEITTQIVSKWTDSEGNIWHKSRSDVVSGGLKGTRFQELDKISESGKKWEFMFVGVFSFRDDLFPKEINTKVSNYWCYYRSEN